MQTRYRACRVMVAGMLWLQVAALANPWSDIFSSYHVYSVWAAFGNNDWYALRIGTAALVMSLSVITFSSNDLNRWLRFTGSAMSGASLIATGALFAANFPPSTGIALFSPGVFCFYIAWDALRNEYAE